jgi:hypothetical protein
MTITDDNTVASQEKDKRAKYAEYMRQWRLKNAEHNYEYNRAYAEKNKKKWVEYRKRENKKRREREDKEPVRAYFREYRKKNPERTQRLRQKYNTSHAEELRQRSRIRKTKTGRAMDNARRRAAMLNRIPAWVDWGAIRAIYAECKRLNREAGIIKYHVDHIFPLKGKTVSGLHVHNNLQIIPAIDNLRKNNKTPL